MRVINLDDQTWFEVETRISGAILAASERTVVRDWLSANVGAYQADWRMDVRRVDDDWPLTKHMFFQFCRLEDAEKFSALWGPTGKCLPFPARNISSSA